MIIKEKELKVEDKRFHNNTKKKSESEGEQTNEADRQ